MSSGAQKEYQYTPLDEARAEQTRLLCLQGGSANEAICAKLQPFALGDLELPRFTALSYTWGSMTKDAAIYVDSALFPVTSNLYAALRHLRDSHEQLWVWVDAICINQTDDAEKSFQVPNIHLLYSAATYCLAWLGQPSEDSELGMRHIRDIGSFLDQLKHVNATTFATPEWQAVLAILGRDYFNRVWIIQELTCARNVFFTCGGIEVHHSQFWKAKDHIVMYVSKVSGRVDIPSGYGVSMLSLIIELKRWLQGTVVFSYYGRKPLLHALTFEAGLKATDPRDHVYATLNLIPRSEWPSAPDYSKDVVRVFADAAAKVINATCSLDILRLCDASQRAVLLPPEVDKCHPKYLKKEVAGQWYAMLPSWIPNWSFTVTRASQNEFRALHGSRGHLYSCDAGTPIPTQGAIRGTIDLPMLWTHAILFDSIQTCRALEIGDDNAWAQLAGHAFGKNDPNSKYQDGEHSLEQSFWRTFMLDCNGSDTCSRATSANVLEFMQRVKNGFDMTDRETSDLLRRRFLVTKTGMFGLGPTMSQAGDYIAIIPGCSVPMILRGSQNSGLYQIIGESYVHGIMDGEIKTALDQGQCDLIEIYIC